MIYISILIIFCYFFILIWLTGGIIYHKKSVNETFHPNISIIISAHNEQHSIKNLLDRLIEQNYMSKYEIIIANDRSTDNTKLIIDEYANEYSYIKCIHVDDTPIGWGHKKWALNKCIEQVQYEIILQTDADCLPGANWVKSMVDNFSNPDVIFISGPAPMGSINNKLNTYYELDSLAQDALSASALSRNIIFSCTGRNMGFLKKSFLDMNGYDDIQHYESGDDDLLIQKFATLLDGKIQFSFNSDSVVISDPPISLKSFLNQRIRYASKGLDYYKLNTTIEFRVFLPFLYLVNLICLLWLILFVQIMDIIYLAPLMIKTAADYWLCSNFYHKINQAFSIKEFLLLSIIHPIYVVSLGIASPFINYNWKNHA